MWYTRGGFKDEHGEWHASVHHFDERLILWEILNEVDHSREYDMAPHSYISIYDAHVAALTTEMEEGSPTAVAPGGPWRGKLGGPSLGGIGNPQTTEAYLRPLLDPGNHTPRNTRLNAVTFHSYSTCGNLSAAGMEVIFPWTLHSLPILRQIQTLRDTLRPSAELHLTESGICCNAPPGCSGNNYSCYYKTADFTRTYWVASAGQWLYQYLLSAQAADLATIAQSQILGYPAKFDGTSGEWPCGSMVDWTENKLSHKTWVQIALLQSLSQPFSFCNTRGGDSTSGKTSVAVYAQGLTSAKGKLLVLINTKSTTQTILVPGVRGKHVSTIDEALGNEPAREAVLGADTVELGAFATMIVHWANTTAATLATKTDDMASYDHAGNLRGLATSVEVRPPPLRRWLRRDPRARPQRERHHDPLPRPTGHLKFCRLSRHCGAGHRCLRRPLHDLDLHRTAAAGLRYAGLRHDQGGRRRAACHLHPLAAVRSAAQRGAHPSWCHCHLACPHAVRAAIGNVRGHVEYAGHRWPSSEYHRRVGARRCCHDARLLHRLGLQTPRGAPVWIRSDDRARDRRRADGDEGTCCWRYTYATCSTGPGACLHVLAVCAVWRYDRRQACLDLPAAGSDQ